MRWCLAKKRNDGNKNLEVGMLEEWEGIGGKITIKSWGQSKKHC